MHILMSHEINVLYCFDDRFWRMATVSIASMLKTKRKDTRIILHCMVAPHTSGRFKIARMMRKSKGRLIWHVVKKRENKFRDFQFLRWSPVIFYRLFACDVFGDTDKLLYIDSDTVVCDDLSVLYNTDISEYAIGAVRDMAPTKDKKNKVGKYVSDFKKKYIKNGLYVNSGVLLLNLPKMREMQDDLLAVSVPLVYPDQDVINVALTGRILELPLRYNFIPLRHDLIPYFISTTKFDKESVEVATNKPVIWHFYSVKPFLKGGITKSMYEFYDNMARSVGFSSELLKRVDSDFKMGRVYKLPFFDIDLWKLGYIKRVLFNTLKLIVNRQLRSRVRIIQQYWHRGGKNAIRLNNKHMYGLGATQRA